MSTRLNQLVSIYERDLNFEKVGFELMNLLKTGDSASARVLLDSIELKVGSWLNAAGGNQQIKMELGLVHLTILLSEDDLPAARLLTRRLNAIQAEEFKLIENVYQFLWVGDSIKAVELCISIQPKLNNFPLAQKSVELLTARIRSHQLQLVQRAYDTISVDDFARVLGLSSPQQVEKFCNMPPDGRFQVESNFVQVSVQSEAMNQEDVSAQIEKLTNLIVFLEGETVTYISPKLPSTVSASIINNNNINNN